MSKPTKTTPQKKRKLARVVIGGGTGSTQRPMYPLTARFATARHLKAAIHAAGGEA